MSDPVQAIKEQEVYVGPRPFERSERDLFFGRDREISELLSLVTSSRVVLCYAPSGAGKTSLINAGLLPRLEKEGFEVLPPTRVRGLVPESLDQAKIPNLYMFNALMSLAGEGGAPDELTGLKLSNFLAGLPHQTDEEGFPAPRILIFDQFEELLTSYPERWQEREGFFQQVHDALQADPLLRVVFVMREDYLARIEPFTRLLKPFPYARFHLDLLKKEGAYAAVVGPLKGTGKTFKEGVAEALVEELLKVRVETTQGEAVEVVGEYVEPVQLQVVCRNLWMSLPPDVQEISAEHVEAYGDVDQALRDFYESSVAQAKTSRGANEPRLRQWFEQQLITPAGTRGIVFRDAKLTAGLPNPVVDFLEDRHLIRGEWRAGSRWYELTHDRFIEPIQKANERWRARRYENRNRWIMAGAGVLILLLAAIALVINTGQTSSQAADVSTKVAATVGVEAADVQGTAQAQSNAQATAQVQAQEDLALSRSRQLAAEALLAQDPDLALVMAVGANRAANTVEARRSLHRILSRQAVIDGAFLREFNPEIVSPTLIKLLEEHTSSISSVAFSPDGQRFVSSSADGVLILWDVVTTAPLAHLATGNSTVMDVMFSPDGKLIAAGTVSGQVLFWNASSGEPAGDPLLGHDGIVICVAFSPDGRRLASGGEDNTIRIWDLSTRQSQMVAEPSDVWSMAWSPDDKTLAAASAGTNVRLLDTETFRDIRRFEGHSGQVRSLAWSPDGQFLASGSVLETNQRTGAEVGEVILWDVESGQKIAQPLRNDFPPASVRALAFTGKILAIGRGDRVVVLWDTRSRKILGAFTAHDGGISSLAFSPDGRYMISGSMDSTVALWDLFPPTRSVALSPDGKFLAASHGAAISLWDLSTDNTTPVKILTGHTEDVLTLAFTPDGSTLVSAGRDSTIRLWNLSTGEAFESPLTGHSGEVLTLDISPDGSTLASAGEFGELFLWDLRELNFSLQQSSMPFIKLGLSNVIRNDLAVIKARFEDGGKTLRLAGENGSLITLDTTSGGSQTQVFPGLPGGGSLTSLAVSPNGERVAFATETGTTMLDDTGRAHGIEISSFDASFNPKVNPDGIDFIVVRATDGLQVDEKFEEFLQPIQAVPMRGAMHLFRPDQPWKEQADLFLSTVKDKSFHFYALRLEGSAEKGSEAFLADAKLWLEYVDEKVEQKIVLQTSNIFMNSFGASGNWMKEWPLLIMYPFDVPNDSPLLPQGVNDWKIWQYSEGQGMGAQYGVSDDSVSLEIYNGSPMDMWEWLELLAISIYDGSSGQLIHPGQNIRVAGLNGIAFRPDGAYVAAAGEGMVSIFNAVTGEEITSLSLGGMQTLSVSFTPDGSLLAVGTEDGTILLWDLSLFNDEIEPEPILENACFQITRSFPDSEWQQIFGDIPKSKICPNLK